MMWIAEMKIIEGPLPLSSSFSFLFPPLPSPTHKLFFGSQSVDLDEPTASWIIVPVEHLCYALLSSSSPLNCCCIITFCMKPVVVVVVDIRAAWFGISAIMSLVAFLCLWEWTKSHQQTIHWKLLFILTKLWMNPNWVVDEPQLSWHVGLPHTVTG